MLDVEAVDARSPMYWDVVRLKIVRLKGTTPPLRETAPDFFSVRSRRSTNDWAE
jgi:hypothetical protein